MSRGRKIGWILSIATLLLTGLLGTVNGVNGLSDTLTPLQRSVSTAVLIYGIIGLAGGLALANRHSSAVLLAVAWCFAVTYVSSLAAIAYAGADTTLVGAVASGIAAALIGAAIVWSARLATRRGKDGGVGDGARAARVVLVLLLGGGGTMAGCRQLYGGPPVVVDRGSDGLVTKRVRAKRDPDRLIADDLSICWVVADVYAGIKPGDHWRCAWRHVPDGQ
jgi:hypothetical protein